MHRNTILLVVIACTAILRAEEPPRVELQYWTSPLVIRTMGEVFERYEREHPGVKIVIGQAAARNLVEDPQRVLCAIVGGDPPDIIVFDRYAVGEWAARGAFLPLDEFLAADKDRPDRIKAEDYYAPCWEEATYRGHLYGIPTGCDNRALYYNKDMLIREGLVDNNTGEARPPKSWEELREYSNKLMRFEGEGTKRHLSVAGFVPNYGNSWLYIYGWQNHAKFMSDDGRTCLLNEPRVVEALSFMKDIYDDLGGMEEVSKFQSSLNGGERDPFLTGQIAMKIDGNWALEGIAAYKSDLNFGVAPAPMRDPNDAPISWLGGWAWVIPKNAKHPREAWDLIRRLASMETALHIAEIEQRSEASQGRMFIPGLNANRKITEAIFKKYVEDEQMEPRFATALRTFIELLPRSKYRPVTPVGQLLWNQQVQAMEQAIAAKPGSGVTPQSALDEKTAVVQRELDRILVPDTGPVVSWSAMVLVYFALLALGVIAGVIWFAKRFTKNRQARKEAYAGWLFAAPWLVGFIIFTGGPILCSLILSFCTYDALAPSHFVGLRNYNEAFTQDPLFWKSLYNTVFMVLGIPLGMAVGLGVAMLLDANVRGIAVYRTLFYLPSIVPGVASAILWIFIFNPNDGLLNWALRQFGIDGPNWLNSKDWSKPALIVQGLWGAGSGMIIWLAGLKAIPQDLYEAAALDGAGALRRFTHITLPMLTPYIFFNLVMGLIGSFQIFGPAYLMTQGGPENSTLFYAYNLFNQALRYLHMGYAGALAWVLFAIVFVLTLYQLRLSKRWVHYQGE